MTALSRRCFLSLSATVVVAACSGADRSSTPASPSVPPPAVAPPAVAPRSNPTTSAPVPVTPVPTSAPTSTAAPTTPPTTEPPVPEYAGDVDPFTLGIASGDPALDGAILWTRLAPDPLNGGGMARDDVAVRWVVGPDGDDVALASGTTIAEAQHGHSVHVTVEGLKPASWYRYSFISGDFRTAEGRFRTAPAVGDGDRLVFGTATCQHYESGFYTAHADIATSELDMVMFLGDYIYEGAGGSIGEGESVRTHATPEPTDLDGYRNRHALYKSDPNLQAAHAACAWCVIWDDHEVENNYAGDITGDIGSATPEAFRRRRDAAYKAWWEHMPVRLPPPEPGKPFVIQRTVDWGSLARFTLLDTRQYRTDQGCGDVQLSLEPACPDAVDPQRTMLGDEQEAWLYDQLDASTATWNVITQQVIFGNTIFNSAVLNYDQWDGYQVQRDRILQHVADTKLTNPVVLTGDVHFAGAGNLREPGGPDKPLIGVEFVTTSISSGGNVDGSLKPIVAALGDIVDVELDHRGWTKHTVTADEWLADFRIVDTVKTEDAQVSTYRTFRVVAGSSEIVSPA